MGRFLDEPGAQGTPTGGKFLDASPPAEIPRGEGDKIMGAPTTPEGVMGGIFGAGQPKELNTVQQIGNIVLPIAATIPATAGIVGTGGTLAARAIPQAPRLAAAGGRALTQGVLSGLQSGSAETGAKDAGVALAWEAILGGLPYARLPWGKSLNQMAAPLRAREAEFARAGKAPLEAYEQMKNYVPPGAWMQVPSISPKPITFEEASKGLAKLKGVDWTAARNEISQELKRGGPSAIFSGPALNPPVKASVALGGTAPKTPYLHEGYNTRVPEARFNPPSTEAERFAKGAVGALQNPMTRTAADIASAKPAEPISDEYTWGELGLMPIVSSLKGLSHRIIGR